MTKRSPWSNPRWRKRSKKLRQNAHCASCGRTSNLQVHHLQYEKILGYKLPLWVAWPWNLMVLCNQCHTQISRIHHSGRANHRQATKIVMGTQYEMWNLWQRTKWIYAPVGILVILAVIALL
jgi:5-methylcytosine-specific restriction endonuclease McrA